MNEVTTNIGCQGLRELCVETILGIDRSIQETWEKRWSSRKKRGRWLGFVQFTETLSQYKKRRRENPCDITPDFMSHCLREQAKDLIRVCGHQLSLSSEAVVTIDCDLYSKLVYWSKV